jgi:hypothetical protein
MANDSQVLSQARKAKQDEFYTQLTDISNEVRHYRAQLRDKVVFCNCDDPYESNFFKYFALNFNALGLRKLVATSYAGSEIVGGQLPLPAIAGLKPEAKEPYAIEISHVPDHDGKGATDITDVEFLLRHDANTARALEADGIYNGGDFRSRECVELLGQADVVVTNPPFSLFREYVTQLETHKKKFLIIGHQNAITYKEIFPLIRDNKIWLGYGFNRNCAHFINRHYEDYASDADHREGFIRVSGVFWYTNMDTTKRHEEIPLFKSYIPAWYPKYDNFDAIEVSKTAEIPCNYYDTMGVPVTFLNKYNPDQFEILGYEKSYELQSKKYPTQTQVSKDGSRGLVSKLNDGAAIKVAEPPVDQTYYIVDNCYYVQVFKRILIKRKK